MIQGKFWQRSAWMWDLENRNSNSSLTYTTENLQLQNPGRMPTCYSSSRVKVEKREVPYSIERHSKVVFSIESGLHLLALGLRRYQLKWLEWLRGKYTPREHEQSGKSPVFINPPYKLLRSCCYYSREGQLWGYFRYFHSTALTLLPQADILLFSLKTFKWYLLTCIQNSFSLFLTD